MIIFIISTKVETRDYQFQMERVYISLYHDYLSIYERLGLPKFREVASKSTAHTKFN